MKRRHRRLIYFITVIAVITFVVSKGSQLVFKILYPLRYEEYIIEYSNKYELDKYLVMSLIKAESNYIYDAHSGFARGLMQITDDTALWISEKLDTDFKYEDLNNPQININMGCYYLKYLTDYYKGNTSLALAAYNAGMGNVNRWLSDSRYSKTGNTLDYIPFPETEKYVEKVNKGINIYKKLYQKQEE